MCVCGGGCRVTLHGSLDCLPLINKLYFNSRTAVFYIHTPFCTPSYYHIYNTTCTQHTTNHVVTCRYVFQSSHVHVFHQSLHITWLTLQSCIYPILCTLLPCMHHLSAFSKEHIFCLIHHSSNDRNLQVKKNILSEKVGGR